MSAAQIAAFVRRKKELRKKVEEVRSLTTLKPKNRINSFFYNLICNSGKKLLKMLQIV